MEKGEYSNAVNSNTYVWYEKNWKHDEIEHAHEYFQLNYVLVAQLVNDIFLNLL